MTKAEKAVEDEEPGTPRESDGFQVTTAGKAAKNHTPRQSDGF
jgi:hypothetical protein